MVLVVWDGEWACNGCVIRGSACSDSRGLMVGRRVRLALLAWDAMQSNRQMYEGHIFNLKAQAEEILDEPRIFLASD